MPSARWASDSSQSWWARATSDRLRSGCRVGSLSAHLLAHGHRVGQALLCVAEGVLALAHQGVDAVELLHGGLDVRIEHQRLPGDLLVVVHAGGGALDVGQPLGPGAEIIDLGSERGLGSAAGLQPLPALLHEAQGAVHPGEKVLGAQPRLGGLPEEPVDLLEVCARLTQVPVDLVHRLGLVGGGGEAVQGVLRLHADLGQLPGGALQPLHALLLDRLQHGGEPGRLGARLVQRGAGAARDAVDDLGLGVEDLQRGAGPIHQPPQRPGVAPGTHRLDQGRQRLKGQHLGQGQRYDGDALERRAQGFRLGHRGAQVGQVLARQFVRRRIAAGTRLPRPAAGVAPDALRQVSQRLGAVHQRPPGALRPPLGEPQREPRAQAEDEV